MKIGELTQDHTGSLVRFVTASGLVYYSFLNVVLETVEDNYRLISLDDSPFFGVSIDEEIEIVRQRKAPSRVGALIRIDEYTYRREDSENYPWLSDRGFSYRDGEVARLIDTCYHYEVVSDLDKEGK